MNRVGSVGIACAGDVKGHVLASDAFFPFADGLEETHVNLNQGAESTISYLLSRLTVEKYFSNQLKPKTAKYTLMNQIESI